MENHFSTEIIISCEHAGNRIPAKYSHLFLNMDDVLASHRGWDPGSLRLANEIAGHLNSPLFAFEISRLLIEINRSIGHRRLFSEFSLRLAESEKNHIVNSFYSPYRRSIEDKIEELNSSGKRVLHLGIHTFTPVFKSKTRSCDIGLLYDPSRVYEKQYCSHLKKVLKQKLPNFKILSNQPYKGVDDGLTTYLRHQIDETKYLGIELEVNQRFLNRKNHFPKEIRKLIANSIEEATLILN
jgi:predicted N-formylglutamate amidohydrolase